MLQNRTATFFDYKTVRGYTRTLQILRLLFYFRIWEVLHIFCYKTVRGHTTRLQCGAAASTFGGFCLFLLTTRSHGAKTLMMAIFSQSKTILFNNIIHLLHSGIHRDLEHSCSILHKSRDGFLPFFFVLRDCTGAHYQTTHRRLRIWGILPIFVYHTARGNNPDDGCFFPFENR